MGNFTKKVGEGMGCKTCKYNQYDGINRGSNICSKYTTHIDPYNERGYCDGYEKKDNRPRGKWKITKAGWAKCPYCKCEREILENFCGYCGADMRGE